MPLEREGPTSMTIDVSEVKKRLHALLNDANLVNKYIRRYGPNIDIKHIKEIKKARDTTTATLENEAEGKDPVYILHVRCPICNQDEIECHELRAKSQQVLQNKFLVPSYEGALGYRTVDYSGLAVTICPRCLFASPDKKDFARPAPSGQGVVKSGLISNVIMTLQERIGERRAVLNYVSDPKAYFARPRNEEAAIASYRLAMKRAFVEAWYEQSYAYYKLGAYALRIAKLIKDGGGNNDEILREAVGYFEEAFTLSNCPSEEIEMQVIYTIIALYLKLGDPKKANSYIAVFANLKTHREGEIRDNPALSTVAIDKWNDKARTLWEDRNEPDLFKDH